MGLPPALAAQSWALVKGASLACQAQQRLTLFFLIFFSINAYFIIMFF